MNRFLVFIFIACSIFQLSAQEQITLTYETELPLQTAFDSEFYHLESSLLLRDITQEITAAAVQNQKQPQNFIFKVNFKSLTGASLTIDYVVNAKAMAFYFEPSRSLEVFQTDTYNWINRSFRSNIPFKD